MTRNAVDRRSLSSADSAAGSVESPATNGSGSHAPT
jgi:hypothetical protein